MSDKITVFIDSLVERSDESLFREYDPEMISFLQRYGKFVFSLTNPIIYGE